MAQALGYHQRTKHHPLLYARGPGYLDWATQPDPFRTFAGAPRTDLPLLADRLTTPFADLYRPQAVAPRPLNVDSIAILFELALGLSAWKQYRAARWALRCNPSSGNLHPTEGYAVVPALPGLAAGVRGTGIGCYFDDVFHDLLGLRGEEFLDLYHFTVGGPVDDPRLTTLPPYAHLKR